MGKRFALLWVISLLTVSLLLSACLGGNQKPEDLKPSLEITIEKVDQYNKLGTKTADGQYIVAHLKLKNLTNKSFDLTPSEFAIRNITENEADQYTQSPETMMFNAIAKQYNLPLDVRDRVLEGTGQFVSHPRIEMERYIVFMLPARANLRRYEIVYMPSNKKYAEVAVPLVTDDTHVNDYRTVF